MDKDQAIHYAGILLDKLYGFRNRATGTKIHDANVMIAILDGYVRAANENRFPGAVQGLNDGIQTVETFLSGQWR